MLFYDVLCSDLPGYEEALIHIELKDVQFKYLKSRTVPLALREHVAKELDCLTQQGTPKPSHRSSW